MLGGLSVEQMIKGLADEVKRAFAQEKAERAKDVQELRALVEDLKHATDQRFKKLASFGKSEDSVDDFWERQSARSARLPEGVDSDIEEKVKELMDIKIEAQRSADDLEESQSGHTERLDEVAGSDIGEKASMINQFKAEKQCYRVDIKADIKASTLSWWESQESFESDSTAPKGFVPLMKVAKVCVCRDDKSRKSVEVKYKLDQEMKQHVFCFATQRDAENWTYSLMEIISIIRGCFKRT